MKRVGKILLITLISIVGILLATYVLLVVKSPGKLEPLKDASGKVIVGSLVEKNFIEIGGIRQGFFIRAENPENPVLLFLHGGPGSPSFPYSVPYESSERLEKYFTVCYWEQRGAGMSYSESTDPASMTVEQIVEDARQMTEYLQNRFKQEKIYLMGHSFGTYLGIKVIDKYPENYLAFIGIGQISNQLESEKLALDFMLQRATETNDKDALRQLKQFDKQAADFPTDDFFMTRSKLLNKYGYGMAHQNFSMTTLIKDVMFFKGYTFSEKMGYIKGSLLSGRLFDYTMKDNLFESSASLDVPVYIIHGKYDNVTSYVLAQEYLNKIEAPAKAFFTFENSAHAPFIEEPEKFIQTMREILYPFSVKIQISNDIELIQLSEKAYVHVSVSEIAGFGKVSSNGLIFVNGKEAFLFDTPATNSQTETLVKWIADSLSATVSTFVPTHWHDDCLGGLEYLHSIEIKSYANQMTIDLAKANSKPVPRHGFTDSLHLVLRGDIVECHYLGGGHSADNIVVWIPSEKILFAGCMVKDIYSKGLGNLSDAKVEEWLPTIQKVTAKFHDAKIVIPGHGQIGGKGLLEHTSKLLTE